MPKLYIDYFSQPSRAVLAFCKLNNIQVDIAEVQVMSLKQYSEDFKKKNPNSQVPCFEDTNGFVVYESHAIMRYLCDTRP